MFLALYGTVLQGTFKQFNFVCSTVKTLQLRVGLCAFCCAVVDLELVTASLVGR